MSGRHADIWSHPGYYPVNPYTWPSDHFWLRYSKFHIWPWKFKVKIMSKVKPNGHIWSLKSNWYVCFSVRGNRTIFGWDIGNSLFDIENSMSSLWPRSNLMVTFETLVSIDMLIYLLFVSWQSHNFWLRYSPFHVWPWQLRVKLMSNGHIWGPEFYRYVCFSLHANRNMFGWDIANSMFHLEN